MSLPFGPVDDPATLRDAQFAARDREWVERIRDGDTSAFEAMFRAYASPLYAYAYSFLRSREIAEELVQDLFLRIWSQRDTWEVPRSLMSYLFQATRNRVSSYGRHARVERSFRERSVPDEQSSPLCARQVPTDEQVHVGELSVAIERAIAALPMRCREVFTLSRQHQLTYAEIADVLQISVKTVEVHMGRALSALRAALSSWGVG